MLLLKDSAINKHILICIFFVLLQKLIFMNIQFYVNFTYPEEYERQASKYMDG